MAESAKVPDTSHLPMVAPPAKQGAGINHGFAAIQRQIEANWDEPLEMPSYSPVMANRAAANLLGLSSQTETGTDTSPTQATAGTIQRVCADCAEEQQADEEKAKIQTKLAIGQPGDKYEQEADRVAQQVVNTIHAPQSQTASSTSPSVVQPQSIPGQPAIPDITLMRQGTGTAAEASADVEQGIQRSRGQGQPLGDTVRAPMEQAFGADFSSVRIHTDGESNELNQAVQAKAFTTGQDIYFRGGAYEPGSRVGQELLAHELTHVVQQTHQIQTNLQRQTEVRHFTTAKIVQCSPLSEELGGLWNVEDKGAFFDRLRSLTPEERGDRELRQFVDTSDRLGPDDRWLAQHILQHGPEPLWPADAVQARHERATQGGWAAEPGHIGGVLGQTAQGRPVMAYYFPGRTGNRALILSGVHGSELSGIQVVEELLRRLRRGPKPHYTVIVVPSLFPDNAAEAESRPEQIGSPANIGRHTHDHPTDPNRQYPALGQTFDPSHPVDAQGRQIEPENVMLLELIQRFQPSRIASVHAVRAEEVAGIFADPRTDETGRALGYESDRRLALEMAQHAQGAGANVPANRLNRPNESDHNAVYPRDPRPVAAGRRQRRDTSRGTSLGGWGATAICDPQHSEHNRPAMRIITVEVQTSRRIEDAQDADARRQEIEAHAGALQEIFLGNHEVESEEAACAVQPEAEESQEDLIQRSSVQDKSHETGCNCAECVQAVHQLKRPSFPHLNTVNRALRQSLHESLIQMNNSDGLGRSTAEISEPRQPKGSSQSSLPDNVKTNMEAMSGQSLEDVQVHLNSSEPAQLSALAYTQGTDIYVGPGQEEHLPHEAWHVVQQKQGRVAATAQMQGLALNNDPGLEKEADEMGSKALQRKIDTPSDTHQEGCGCSKCTAQVQMQTLGGSENAQLKQFSIIQRVPYNEENDRTVLQGDSSGTSCPLTLLQLFQLFALDRDPIEFQVTNRDGNSQTIRFTQSWIHGPQGTAVIRGRVRYEIDQNIGARQQDIEDLISQLPENSRTEELESYCSQSRSRYEHNGLQTVESGPVLVEQAYNSGRAFRARGYNYRDFRVSDSRGRERRGPNTQGIEFGVDSWEQALALEPEMRRRIREGGYTDEQIDSLHQQRLERSRRSAGLNEYNQHLIRLHAAWDISGPLGTAVYAPIAGTVVEAHSMGRRRSMYGNFIRIRHDRVPTFNSRDSEEESSGSDTETVYTNYCHLAELLVQQDQQIHPGQALGLMGHSGLDSGTHLHFSVVRGNRTATVEEVGSSINPQTWWTQVTGNTTPYESQIRLPSDRRESRRRVGTLDRQGRRAIRTGRGHPSTVQPKLIDVTLPIQQSIIQLVAEGCEALTQHQITHAVQRNNAKQFRIDWVRNLQLELVGSRVSTDGDFDDATVRAIADFQTSHFDACGDIDGIIGRNTRRALESTYSRLLTTVTGSHLQPRQLVPGRASEEQKYDYYQSVVAESGGHFLTDPMVINLLGIRGIERRDDGSIWQTSSAQDFAAARASGTSDDHLQWTAFDDLIVSLWLDNESNKHASERMGSVDPASAYTRTDRPGTAHLRDGQYQYRTGRHRTSSPSHVAAATGIADPDDLVDVAEAGTDDDGRRRIAYDALVPSRRQEVWRESRARGTNDLYLDETEEQESQEAIYRGDSHYFAGNFAINIHTSSTTQGNSVACQNIPADQYVEFMREIQAASNSSNILYTLIDASKIESGLVLESSEQLSSPLDGSAQGAPSASDLINPWADEPPPSTSAHPDLADPWADEPIQRKSLGSSTTKQEQATSIPSNERFQVSIGSQLDTTGASALQRFGGGESDTMRIHRERAELYRRHGSSLSPDVADGEIVHGGHEVSPLDSAALSEELIRETLRYRSEGGSLIPIDYIAHILRERTTHADIEPLFESIVDAAGTTSWETQMLYLETHASRLLHAIENHWVHDPTVSGLDVLGQDAAQYRDFSWHQDDYPGGNHGPHEGRARAMARDLSQVVPERRPNQGDSVVVNETEFSHEAEIQAYILANLRVVPSFSSSLPGTAVVPTQPHNRRLLGIACDAFIRMRDAALADGVALIVGAGWRSFAVADANAEDSGNPMAVASFSSHTLGLAMDLNLGAPGTSEHSTADFPDVMAMRRTDAYRWMILHAHEYGWYPWHNEPWHWEYNPPGFRDQFLAAVHAPTEATDTASTAEDL